MALDIIVSYHSYIISDGFTFICGMVLRLVSANSGNKPHNIIISSYRVGVVFNGIKLVLDICKAYYFKATSHNTLLEEATRNGVVVKLGSVVVNTDFSHSSVYLTNGKVCTRDLILRTNGEHSQYRELLL